MPIDITYSDPCRSPEEAMRSVRQKQVQAARLTIGIPAHNRPEMLVRAVKSALAQSISVRVLVSDDNPEMRFDRLLCEHFPKQTEDGHVVRIPSGTTGLWQNWDAAARACNTEFFLWLQDDDVLMPYAAARVVSAFDEFSDADLWLAPCKLGLDEKYHWWNNGNGPWVPLRDDGGRDHWGSEIFAPTCYFLAWSLSPAVAFRVGDRFRAMLDAIPPDCAIFAERLVLVLMGQTRFISDPYVAGKWIQHKDNEHRKLHDDQPRQTKILIRLLDEAMDRLGDSWREALATWCRLQHPNWIMGWLGDLDHAEAEGGQSRYGDAIREVMIRSFDGRVKYVPRYRWWRRAINAGVGWVKKRAAL